MSKSEMFVPEEIAIIQTRQLRKTLHYVYERSPFYRDLLDGIGAAPAEIKSLDDLARLPTTSEEDLSGAGDRFLCVRPEEVADEVTIPATSGAPIFFKLSEADLSRLAYNEQISFCLTGLNEKDVVALAVTLDHCSLAGMAYYMGLRRLGAAVLRLGPVPPELLLRRLEQAGATAIVAPTSFLQGVAGYAREGGLDLKHTGVRKLIGSGEPLRRSDFSLNAPGRAIAAQWSAPVFATYTSTELSTSFCECEAGCGGHLHPELIYLEIVDEAGRPVPAGEVGEVCATPFGVTGMPLLRYRTGDFSFLRTEACACGRQTPRLGPILGRRNQKLKAEGVTLFPGNIHEVVQSEPNVQAHVLVAESGDSQSDKLTLLLETNDREAAGRIRERLQRELKIFPEVRVIGREEMQAFQNEGAYRPSQIFSDRRPSSPRSLRPFE